jgi:peptidoglycan-N-acetylglucosamine deacetylase
VAAIGPIIDSLRARGDTIVLLSALLGLTRDQAMPPLTAESATSRGFTLAAFFTLGATQTAIGWLFLVAVALGSARIVVLLSLAIAHRVRTARRSAAGNAYAPSVSVIVPAYNEAKVIERTIRSLLAQRYRGLLEIVVVDDGSPDATGTIARSAFRKDDRVAIFTKPNGGKASALNFGIQRATCEIVIRLPRWCNRCAIHGLARWPATPRSATASISSRAGRRWSMSPVRMWIGVHSTC